MTAITRGPLRHVAVNTRFLLPNRLEGLGRFTWEVVRQLTATHPDVQFSFLFDRPYDPAYICGANVRPVVLFPPARHPLLFMAWFDGALPAWLARHQPDVFFSPDSFLSLRTSIPQVAVIHDLAYIHEPQGVSPVHRWYYQVFMPRFARKAQRLLTVSEYTRQDVIRQFGISPSKITVCHNGQTASFKPSAPEAIQTLRKRLGLAEPYFLYAGAIHPRKNIGNLLWAFDLFKARTGLPHLLVLTGRMAWKTQADLQIYDTLEHRTAVRFTGRLDDADLNTLYGGAVALCYVSRFEGFGLPILEAFQAETAVITSGVSSMPEVAGDAALLVDPASPESIASALETLATQAEFRRTLVERGRLQRERFSWARTANTVWEALEAAQKDKS